MSRSKNILVVVIAICVVLAVGITHIVVILSGIGDPPAEWKDYFILNGTRYYNSYSIIDSSYADKVVGKISAPIPRDAGDSSDMSMEGQAVYLRTGTLIYSIKGFDRADYVAAYDNGDYFLYCTDNCSPAEVIKRCGIKTLRKDLDYKCFFIDTVYTENSDYGIRLSTVLNKSELDKYLSRYSNDFKLSDNNYTYRSFFEKRNYDDFYFKDKLLIVVRLPEDDGKIIYELDRIISDDSSTTVLLTENCLPENVLYDKCTVRHLFIEIAKKDYSDQTLSFQVERKYHHFPDEKQSISDDDPVETPQEYVFSLIKNRTQAVGTVYEELVLKEYDKSFFDTNDLLILRCVDEKNEYDYSFTEFSNDDYRYFYVSLLRSTALNERDNRPEYFVFPIPSDSIGDRLILPEIIETDPEEPSDGPVPVNDLCDSLIIDSLSSFENISDKYDLDPELYNEVFFKDKILFLTGYKICSPDVSIEFKSINAGDGIIELTVLETIPDDIEFSPTFKCIPIPYLRVNYNNEDFVVNTYSSTDDEYYHSIPLT